jgi:hypothetical protein
VPKIFIAAVGDLMTGPPGRSPEVYRTTPSTTRRYLDEVTAPALQAGLDAAAGPAADFELSCPLFVVTRARRRNSSPPPAAAHRKQLAF